MSLLTAKLGALATLFFTSLLLGLLPFPLRPWLREGATQRRGPRLALSCLQCLGGGVLLATVLTHMLPEIRESLEAGGRGGEFPLAEVLLCAGMFSIYAVEELAMLLMPAAVADSGSDDTGPPILQSSGAAAKMAEANGDQETLRPNCGTGDRAASPMLQRPGAAKMTEANGDPEVPRSNYGAVSPPDYGAVSPVASGGHGHSHVAAVSGGGGLASFRVLIVTAALSVHSVFEGVAIGLEPSEPSVWLLTAAIATHKAIIAFCLGEQLAASQRQLRAAVGSLLIFVSASPLGVVIGLLVSSGDGDVDSQAFTTDVLQALAAGTILYVVLFEIIQSERAKPGGGLLKLLAILAGFGIMLLVTAFLQEPDDDQPRPAANVTAVLAN